MLFALCSVDFAQNIAIKSLQVYSGSDPLSLPIAASSKEWKQNLTIEFDVAAFPEPNLVIEFKLCDVNWNPYTNLFLVNQGRNTSQTLWFESIKIPNAGANYHYKGSFPNFDVTFPFPGKWIFYIRDSMYKERIYAQGAFYVVHHTIPVKAHLAKEVMDGPIPDKIELNRVYSLDADFVLPDSLFPSNVMGIEIVENRKIYNAEQVGRINTGLRNFYYDGGHSFTFNARDLHPGNGYRRVDLNNKTQYVYPNTNAHFDGIEIPDFYNYRRHDLVGGSLILNYRNENSHYLNVKFRLRLPENNMRKVFVVGAFTNWLVLPGYEMLKENGIYTLDVELKRGEYDYMYVLGDIVDGQITNIDWYSLEGNFWETDNDYHVFVFYNTPEKGGFNKIIGYKKIRSGEI